MNATPQPKIDFYPVDPTDARKQRRKCSTCFMRATWCMHVLWASGNGVSSYYFCDDHKPGETP